MPFLLSNIIIERRPGALECLVVIEVSKVSLFEMFGHLCREAELATERGAGWVTSRWEP
jgi:hypothetical protein